MKQYWVSVIIQNENDKKVWCSKMENCVLDIETAMELIQRIRKNYTVLSAWVDTFDENDKKHIVFHECYINALGHVEKVDDKKED